jgi:hypothetical protein
MAHYKSKYTLEDKTVTAAQYLAELMCERNARLDGKELPHKFWESREWNQIFRRHVTQCNRLLKKYREDAVIAAFFDDRTKSFISFGNPRYVRVIKEHEANLKALDNKPLEVIKAQPISLPRKPIGNKSPLTKLKEFEAKYDKDRPEAD